MTKKVGILGSGQVAKVLGMGFIKHGYEAMLGTGDTGKLHGWKEASGAKAQIGTFEEAAEFGSLIVLAVKGIAAEGIIKKTLPALSGKTVIDTTNPIAETPPQNGVLAYFTDVNHSLMEKLQHIASETNFVKAFNSVGNARMVNPQFKEGRPTMFICGNSDAAKKEVSDILDLFGWDIADMGKAEAARAIEPLCMLWCIPGFLQNQWTHAFRLLKT